MEGGLRPLHEFLDRYSPVSELGTSLIMAECKLARYIITLRTPNNFEDDTFQRLKQMTTEFKEQMLTRFLASLNTSDNASNPCPSSPFSDATLQFEDPDNIDPQLTKSHAEIPPHTADTGKLSGHTPGLEDSHIVSHDHLQKTQSNQVNIFPGQSRYLPSNFGGWYLPVLHHLGPHEELLHLTSKASDIPSMSK